MFYWKNDELYHDTGADVIVVRGDSAYEYYMSLGSPLRQEPFPVRPKITITDTIKFSDVVKFADSVLGANLLRPVLTENQRSPLPVKHMASLHDAIAMHAARAAKAMLDEKRK